MKQLLRQTTTTTRHTHSTSLARVYCQNYKIRTLSLLLLINTTLYFNFWVSVCSVCITIVSGGAIGTRHNIGQIYRRRIDRVYPRRDLSSPPSSSREILPISSALPYATPHTPTAISECHHGPSPLLSQSHVTHPS